MGDLIFWLLTELEALSPGDVILGMGFLCLWAPVCVLIHELGHAVFALADTDGLVIVCMGTGGGLRLSAGRILFDVGLSADGVCVSGPGTFAGRLLGTLAGPCTSLAAAGLLYVLMQGYPSLALFLGAGAVMNALGFVTSIVLWRNETRGSSDGWLVLSMLTGRPTGNEIRG